MDVTDRASHDQSVNKDILEHFLLLFRVELVPEVLVQAMDLISAQKGESTGNGQSLEGDLLLGNVNNVEKILIDDLLEQSLHLGDQLGSVSSSFSLLFVAVGSSGQDVSGQTLVGRKRFLQLGLINQGSLLIRGLGSQFVLIVQAVEFNLVAGVGNTSGASILALVDQGQVLFGSSQELLGVKSKEVLLELTLVDNGLDVELTAALSAGSVAGDGRSAPHAFTVSSSTVKESGLVIRKGGPLAARRNIPGLDDLVVLRAGGARALVGGNLGLLSDHVSGELIDLVGDITDSVKRLFLGLPVRDTARVRTTIGVIFDPVNSIRILLSGVSLLELGLEESNEGLLEVDRPLGLILIDDDGDESSAGVQLENGRTL